MKRTEWDNKYKFDNQGRRVQPSYLDDPDKLLELAKKTAPPKRSHIHQYQYVGEGERSEEWRNGDKMQGTEMVKTFKFVCPISGCSKPVKVVKEK